MRNLRAYPVTKDEIVSALQRASQDLPPDLVGDMRPVIFRGLSDFVRDRMSQKDLRDFFGIK